LSTTSDIALRAIDLTKVYRLYARQRHRLLDIVGALPAGSDAYREHRALDSVSLEIPRGQKVAIIGRNGAGKSTLMKLISRVIQPTSGTLQVNAQVNALLQIGTGFHPDFTGRENVFAYLAQLDVNGARADRLFGEVVDFAELEEYIDQPVKTYSTGMAVRLMFATSTAIEPDLLLLDEVLGVGDAYFAQKSFNRIRFLCSAHGTTLLLVTHDVYAASRLCDRMIWIDRGRVVLDGAAADVIRAYEDSIRVQEEHRLRTRRLSAMKALRSDGRTTAPVLPLLVEIAAVQNAPQASAVYFSEIALRRGNRAVAALPLVPESEATAEQSALQSEATSWGDPVSWHGAPSRPMVNYGSPYHRVAGVLGVPPDALRDAEAPLELRIRYWCDEPCALELRVFADAWAADLGRLPVATGAWTEHVVRIAADAPEQQTFVPSPNASGNFGTGDIQIVNVAFVGDDDRETDVLRHGDPARLRIDYHIKRPDLRERAQVIVVVHRDGIQDVCRMIARDLMFDASSPSGQIELTIPRVDLVDGRYALTVMIAEPGYHDQRQHTFFAIHPGVYSCLSRAFELKVTGAGVFGEGTITVKDGLWSQRAGVAG
jgi:lipopolysaccharide transport system ATP-binding protein